MEKDYKEKIRKLLALAESPNEHEAKAALLKARQLMAEHKLSEKDCKDAGRLEVRDVQTGITCSKRREFWVVSLSAVIGENYCCKTYSKRFKNEQTLYIGFIGLEDDVEVCTAVFKYAVDCVRSEIERIKKTSGYSGIPLKSLCDGYGCGFVKGLTLAFAKQQKENEEEWGLVLVMPEEVEEAGKDLKKERFAPKAAENISKKGYRKGYRDGENFDPTKRLAEA